jgi:transposase
VRALERRIAELDKHIGVEVEASGTTLTEIFGVGPILAAKIVGIVGNVARFPSKAHFASYAGVAPIARPQSSGEVVRHRLSLAGNPRLNQVMRTLLLPSAKLAAIPHAGGAYHRKKLAEGKSRAGRRCAASSDASRMLCVRGARRRFGARYSGTGLTQRGLVEGAFSEQNA